MILTPGSESATPLYPDIGLTSSVTEIFFICIAVTLNRRFFSYRVTHFRYYGRSGSEFLGHMVDVWFPTESIVKQILRRGDTMNPVTVARSLLRAFPCMNFHWQLLQRVFRLKYNASWVPFFFLKLHCRFDSIRLVSRCQFIVEAIYFSTILLKTLSKDIGR